MEARLTAKRNIGESWVKRVVVAADGSPASTRGLEQVADLARRTGASVVVVHVRHLPAAALMASGIDGQPVLDSLDQLEFEVRRQAVRILDGAALEWRMVVRAGSVGEEIVKVVVESCADLVVVGSDRHSSLHNLLLGSTAAYLTAHSPVPVLVMRSPPLSEPVPLAAATR